MVKIKAQRRVAKNCEIFTFLLNATSGMGKLEIFRTETCIFKTVAVAREHTYRQTDPPTDPPTEGFPL